MGCGAGRTRFNPTGFTVRTKLKLHPDVVPRRDRKNALVRTRRINIWTNQLYRPDNQTNRPDIQEHRLDVTKHRPGTSHKKSEKERKKSRKIFPK